MSANNAPTGVGARQVPQGANSRGNDRSDRSDREIGSSMVVPGVHSEPPSDGDHDHDTPSDLETPPVTGASPSFSFHEERRLLKSDEYWLSHKLPRLPPAAMATSPTASMDALMQSTRSSPTRARNSSTTNPPSPVKSTHTAKSTPPPNDREQDVNTHAIESDSSEDLGPHGTGAYHGLSRRRGSTRTLSGAEFGDYDPSGVDQHRNRLNYDEALGLEEEKEERALGMDDAFLPAGEERHQHHHHYPHYQHQGADEMHEAAVDTGESPS